MMQMQDSVLDDDTLENSTVRGERQSQQNIKAVGRRVSNPASTSPSRARSNNNSGVNMRPISSQTQGSRSPETTQVIRSAHNDSSDLIPALAMSNETNNYDSLAHYQGVSELETSYRSGRPKRPSMI